jgi:hypothetical protein
MSKKIFFVSISLVGILVLPTLSLGQTQNTTFSQIDCSQYTSQQEKLMCTYFNLLLQLYTLLIQQLQSRIGIQPGQPVQPTEPTQPVQPKDPSQQVTTSIIVTSPKDLLIESMQEWFKIKPIRWYYSEELANRLNNNDSTFNSISILIKDLDRNELGWIMHKENISNKQLLDFTSYDWKPSFIENGFNYNLCPPLGFCPRGHEIGFEIKNNTRFQLYVCVGNSKNPFESCGKSGVIRYNDIVGEIPYEMPQY